MAHARRQVLIVHGWSDTYESFQPLKNLLVAAGYETAQVFLGNYASMRDDVTFAKRARRRWSTSHWRVCKGPR